MPPSNQRFGKYTQKSRKEQPTKNSADSPLDGRQPCYECAHEDGEQITPGSFPFQEIFPRFVGQSFNPNAKNIFAGSIMGKSHHVKGEGAKTRKDFLNFKACFCLEWIDIELDGELHRGRCGNMYNFKSPGCCDHTRSVFKSGPNDIYTLLARGDCGNWGMIKDPNAKSEKSEPTEEQNHAQAKTDLGVLAEQMAAAYEQGKDVEQVRTEYMEKARDVSQMKKRRNSQWQDSVAFSEQHSNHTPSAASDKVLRLTSKAASVFGNRHKIGKSGPGIPTLDQKHALSNGNKNYRSNSSFTPLAGVTEEGEPVERKKPKTKKKKNM